MLKHWFPEALTVNQYPKTTVCTLFKYIDDKRQQINDSFQFNPRQRT